jgi:carbon storage regulator
MLILSRKVGQCIVIGGNIIVKVVRVEGDQIKLGIQAPREVPVHREEIQREIDKGKPGGGASALKAALGLPM